MVNDPQNEQEPEAIYCPNPKCEGGEVVTTTRYGITRDKGLKSYCPICDGAMVLSSLDGTSRMWDAIAWADKHAIAIEPADEELYQDPYGGDGLDD